MLKMCWLLGHKWERYEQIYRRCLRCKRDQFCNMWHGWLDKDKWEIREYKNGNKFLHEKAKSLD